jgi:GAF domain-containing protein
VESRELWLAQTFVELADTLVDEFDVVDFLSLLAFRCQELFAPSEVGFLLADQTGTLHVLASSSERLRLLELFELQNEEGPCFEAFRSGEAVLNRPLAGDNTWPRFSAEALSRGFVMAHALPMRLRGVAIGSVNILQDHDRPVADLEISLAQTMADVATIGILQQRALQRAAILAEQLEGALNTRIVIEQAKGVLLARLDTSVDDVFARMRSYARRTNRLLADVARDVVTGVLPPSTFPPRRLPDD